MDNIQWKTWMLVIEGNIYRRMKRYNNALKVYKEAFNSFQLALQIKTDLNQFNKVCSDIYKDLEEGNRM